MLREREGNIRHRSCGIGGGGGDESGIFASGALGAVVLAGGLALAAALFLAPGAARAVNDCGALNAGNMFTENCPDAAYTGIVYWDQANAVTLTVPGTATTATVTAGANNGLHNGITIRTNDDTTSPRTSAVRNIGLTVGGSGTFVAIVQSGTRASSWYNNRGILVRQRDGDGATTTLDVKSGVTIGTATDKMENGGIEVVVDRSDAGDVTVTSGAAIYSEADGDRPGGIHIGNAGSGAVTLTNSGAIVSDARGINVQDTGSAGAITITSRGAITSAATTALEGIRAVSTGKDAASTNAGVSVTHSAGAIAVAMGGVGIKAHVGTSRSEGDTGGGTYVTPENEGLAKVAVTGGSVTSKGNAVEAFNYEAGSVVVEVSDGATLTSTEGFGIDAVLTDVGNTAGTISVTNRGAITAGTQITVAAGMTTRTAKHGINVNRAAGSGAVSVTNSGAVTADGYGISAVARGAGGTVSVTNSGALGTAEDRVSRGISASHDGTSGSLTVANSGAIHAEGYGINVESGSAGTVSVSVEHSDGSITSSGSDGIRVLQSGTGAVTVASSADVTAKRYGVFVDQQASAGTVSVSVEHSAGDIAAETESGIHAQNAADNAGEVKVAVTGGSVSTEGQSKAAVAVLQRGTGDAVASLAAGATLTSKHNAGIYANLASSVNTAGQVKVTQGGTIAGRKGVYARAGRASAAGETRDAMKPVLDVTWTGTFSHGTTASVAQDDADRFVAAGAGALVTVAGEVETEKAIRYGQAAGIEAQVLSWRDVMAQVAAGDDPGMVADNAAQMNLLSESHADSQRTEILRAFKAALGNDDIEVAESVFDAITPGATNLAGLGATDDAIDAAIVAYLETDDAATRTLLQEILTRSFSEKEKAVLRAVVTNTGLEAALAAEDAGFSDDYKGDVRALLDKYNVGDIRVAMTGGSIDSRGDGIRAYYATPNDKNGAIDVTIAAGTTVTGGMAGIYVANAGMGTDDVLKQTVTVHGMVTGGTDAAVHLSGGGRLTVGEMGRVLAGTSGIGVLVNDPGPAHLTIGGLVRGGAGGAAAVRLTGGGELTVGATGRVEANGATSAIRTDGSRTDLVIEGEVKGSEGGEAAVHLAGGGRVTIRVPTGSGAATPRPRVDANEATRAIRGGGASRVTVVEIRTTGNVQDHRVRKSAADAAVDGSIDPDVRVAVVQLDDAGGTTGHSRGLPLIQEGEREGEFDPSSFTPTPVPTITITASVTVMASVTTMTEPTTVTARVPVPSPTQPPQTQPLFECTGERGAADRRCELYEALPSVLLTMNGMLSYAERSSAARDANGGWARVEGARGKWEAKKASSTTGRLSYDHRRGGVRAGVDLGAGEHGRVGVSAHLLNGKAERAGVGDVEVDGMGAGASATWRWGEWYADAQAGATWYEVGVDHRESGVLVKEADGLGYAMEVEAGRGMAMGGGLVVTPRVGLAWSKVGMDDFTFTSKVGTQETVSVEDAHSARGRLGVLVEAEAGMGERSGRLFGSLDVEQEFSDETRVDVGATSLTENVLKTEVRSTTVRLGVGGVLGLGEDLVLRGTAGYETSGSGTSGYGGGLELNLRF